MSPFPASFIQVHHHDRPGGVTTVMRGYAEAFARIRGSAPHANLVFCNSTNPERTKPARTVSCAACDYRDYRSAADFDAAVALITSEIINLAARDLPRPVCLVLHNPGLAKNVALSRACEAALESSRSDNIRLFVVAHDLAEEGRLDRLDHCRVMDAAGVPTRDCRYPASAWYVCPSDKNRILLRMAGIHSRRLANPVGPGRAAPAFICRDKGGETLGRLARADGCAFDPARPIIFYPVRLIGRKNVAEAIVVACALEGANLVLGSPGTAKADQALYAALKQACQRLGLCVVFDIERIAREYGPKFPADTVFPLMYELADRCISTSVAEGFGYALYEPLMYDKQIIGRLPDMFVPEPGLVFPSVYTWLPIPVDWIDIHALARRYHATLCDAWPDRTPRSFRRFNERFFESNLRESLIRDGCIDYANLDCVTQISVLERITRGDAELKMLKEAYRRQLREGDNFANHMAASRPALARLADPDAFDRAFEHVFSRTHRRQHRPRTERVADFFSRPGRFRLNIAPCIR